MTNTLKAIRSGNGEASRRLRGGKNFSMAPLADLTDHKPKTCQYIENGEMCGKPGFPYCPSHGMVTHRQSDRED